MSRSITKAERRTLADIFERITRNPDGSKNPSMRKQAVDNLRLLLRARDDAGNPTGLAMSASLEVLKVTDPQSQTINHNHTGRISFNQISGERRILDEEEARALTELARKRALLEGKHNGRAGNGTSGAGVGTGVDSGRDGGNRAGGGAVDPAGEPAAGGGAGGED